MRTWILLTVPAAIACGSSPTDLDFDPSTPSPLASPILAYGRVHDASDQNLGIAGATVSLGDGSVTSDPAGQYRIEDATGDLTLRVDATADGWTPHVIHLPPGVREVEVWPGLLPRDDAEQLAAVMAASSDIVASYDPTVAYIIVQVRHIGASDSLLAGAEVSVTLDGQPTADIYTYGYNDTLETCIPTRAPDAVATSDVRCDGLVVVPGVDDGVEVAITLDHPERSCARTTEQRLAGDVASALTYTITAEADGLNLTGVECDPTE